MEDISYFCKPKSKVSKSEKEELSRLHYSDGLCWPKFKKLRGYVIIAKLGKLCVGWAFIFKENKKIKTFYVFVHKDFRRKGIGSKLFLIATNIFGKLYTSKHDRKSSAFYKKVQT